MKNKKFRYEWTGKTYFIDEKDDRFKKFSKIKERTGISPDETWNLYGNITTFVLPRLKMFKKYTIGAPGCFRSQKAWFKVLDKMIWSFEQIENEEEKPDDMEDAEYQKKISYGLKLFGKYFRYLWW